MRESKPIAIQPQDLFQGILGMATLVCLVAGMCIVGSEKVPGLDYIGFGLVVVYVGGLALIAGWMEFDYDRRLVLIHLPPFRRDTTRSPVTVDRDPKTG